MVGALDSHVFQYFLNLPQNYSLRSSSTFAVFFIYLKNQFWSHRISTISFYYNLHILGVLYWNNSPPHNGPLEYRSVLRKVAFKQSYLLFKGRILIKVAEYVTKERPSLRSWHVVEWAHAIRKFSTSRVQQTAVPLICGMGILGIRKSKVLTVFLSRMVIERRRMRTADRGWNKDWRIKTTMWQNRRNIKVDISYSPSPVAIFYMNSKVLAWRSKFICTFGHWIFYLLWFRTFIEHHNSKLWKSPLQVHLRLGLHSKPKFLAVFFLFILSVCNLRRQSKILRCHHWLSHEMTSEKQAQKFHTDDVTLPRSG